MSELLSLCDTIETIVACNDDGDLWDRYAWIYADGDDALSARFYLSSGDEEEDLLIDEDGEGLPVFAAEHALSHYLEASTFVDVLLAQKRQRPLSELHDYAAALDYYLRMDVCLELGEASDADIDAALHLGLASGLHTEFDLVLPECPVDRQNDAARILSQLFALSIADALALCRQSPLNVGRRVNTLERERIQRAFAGLGLPLTCTTYHALPWSVRR